MFTSSNNLNFMGEFKMIDFNVRKAENGFVVSLYNDDENGPTTYVCGSFAQVKKLLTKMFVPNKEKAVE